MDFKVLVMMALLNLAISMPGPDPGVVVNVNVNVQDNDDANNRPDIFRKDSGNVKCGIVKSASTRIINGDDVNVPRKYSWQVSLFGRRPDADPFCGGSIITDRHILTAAHCVCGMATINVLVRIGDHALNVTKENLPEFSRFRFGETANGITIHENYNCFEFASDQANDIAIIKLSEPIDLMKHAGVIHPICLPKDDSETYAGLTATITGWGSSIGHTPIPKNPTPRPKAPSNSENILQEAQITVLSNSKCLEFYPLKIFATMICALGDKVIADGFVTGTCFGDSGGPIFTKEKEQHVQIGITSFGDGCGAEQEPSVYTRVSKYLKWIKEEVGSEMIYTLH